MRAAYREALGPSLGPERATCRGARSLRGGLPTTGACPRCGFLGPDFAAAFCEEVQRAFLGALERLGVGMRWISYFR